MVDKRSPEISPKGQLSTSPSIYPQHSLGSISAHTPTGLNKNSKRPRQAADLDVQSELFGSGTSTPTSPPSKKRKIAHGTRNAGGYLFRKDGLPDMRSRRNHARPEGQHSSGGQPETRSSKGSEMGSDASTAATDILKKHQTAMNMMFPHGVEAFCERSNYAKQLFRDKRPNTSQSCNVSQRGKENTMRQLAERHLVPLQPTDESFKSSNEGKPLGCGTTPAGQQQANTVSNGESIRPTVKEQHDISVTPTLSMSARPDCEPIRSVIEISPTDKTAPTTPRQTEIISMPQRPAQIPTRPEAQVVTDNIPPVLSAPVPTRPAALAAQALQRATTDSIPPAPLQQASTMSIQPAQAPIQATCTNLSSTGLASQRTNPLSFPSVLAPKPCKTLEPTFNKAALQQIQSMEIFNQLPTELRDPFMITYHFQCAKDHWTQMYYEYGRSNMSSLDPYPEILKLAGVYYYFLARPALRTANICVLLRVHPNQLKEWIARFNLT
ncbi:hypothetical protein K469DRAFT_132323 [Zopfia rhizophila CBS 207.26]|uniref:Uncharacterized protein n=1 Tax=Zopfia rhizophila CBS 207.26 TaxID=1314779 RepID=A0A6A6EVA8_9PEZI|nr:hypothetical protein K469DRAFT_132323 [Zopfia rhizophila CBS 207.26]